MMLNSRRCPDNIQKDAGEEQLNGDVLDGGECKARELWGTEKM